MASLIQVFTNALVELDQAIPLENKRIFLKEAAQSLVLDFIYNHKSYRGMNFYGGTCLRVVYGLNRLSEDLDLDNQGGINLDSLGEDLVKHISEKYNFPNRT